jgi:diguanylate cyclase (GGDEF)-like protein
MKNLKSKSKFYVALFDVDYFKDINDSFGHHGGDAILKIISKRLTAINSSKFFVARLGGDEFGLVYDGPTKDSQKFFDTVLECFRTPVVIDRISRRFSASAGVASYPDDGSDLESLLKAADLALYNAKKLGRDRIEVFINACWNWWTINPPYWEKWSRLCAKANWICTINQLFPRAKMVRSHLRLCCAGNTQDEACWRRESFNLP